MAREIARLSEVAMQIERKAFASKVPTIAQVQELASAVEAKVKQVQELAIAVESKATTNVLWQEKFAAAMERKADVGAVPTKVEVQHLSAELKRKCNVDEV